MTTTYKVLSKERKVDHAALAVKDVLKGGLKRVHGLAALDRMGGTPQERLNLLKTIGYLDVVLHTIEHARSPNGYSFRSRELALNCLFRHILDNPKVDELILSHPQCVSALVSVLQDEPTEEMMVLVATVFDYLAVTPALRPILVFQETFIDDIIPFVSSPYPQVRLHLLKMFNYISQDGRVLFTLARHEAFMEAMCGACIVMEDDETPEDDAMDSDEELMDMIGDLEDEEVEELMMEAEEAGVTLKELLDNAGGLFGGNGGKKAMEPTQDSYALNCLLNIARLPANIRTLQENEILLDVVMDFAQKAKNNVDRDLAGQIIDLLTEEAEDQAAV